MSEEKESKKLCTEEDRNEPPTIPASPPRFVSLEELMAAARGMTQMSLVHEIAVDKDFKLERKEPPANSIAKIVKETMHKAFWDCLKEELKQEKPSYSRALLLLEEVKTGLMDLLLPQHTRLKQKIDEVLDMDLLKQQAEKGTLHEQYQDYAQYVISVMAKLCAPIRDDRITELTKTKDIVPLFQGILDTLSLMKIDMANFTIDVMRPQIVATSVEYEKEKFAKFLKVHPDGLVRTKEWLKKHTSAAGDSSLEFSKRVDKVINHALLDLVQWNTTDLLPETLTMDEARIASASKDFRQITRAGTVLLVTFSHAGPNLNSIATWKQKTKETVLTLLNSEPPADLSAVATKLHADTSAAAAEFAASSSVQANLTGLEEAIKAVDEPNHKIHDLLRTRILEFLDSAIASRTADRLRVPIGLSILQEEVTQLAGKFLRMVSYNKEVFGEYYSLLTKALLTDLEEDNQRIQ